MALENTVAALELAQANVKQDIQNVRKLVTALQQNVTDLTALVQELQGQLPTPELEARIQAVADSLSDTDAQLDAIAPDEVTPPAG